MTCTIDGCDLKHRAKGLCHKHYSQWWRTTYPDRMKNSKQQHYKRYRVKLLEEAKQKRKEHPELFVEARKRTYQNRKERELASAKKWRENNPERMEFLRNRYRNKRAERLKVATPKWVDQEALKQIYQNCPKGKVIDHVAPLLGKNICGLHVPWNLQYLTHEENVKKGNRF